MQHPRIDSYKKYSMNKTQLHNIIFSSDKSLLKRCNDILNLENESFQDIIKSFMFQSDNLWNVCKKITSSTKKDKKLKRVRGSKPTTLNNDEIKYMEVRRTVSNGTDIFLSKISKDKRELICNKLRNKIISSPITRHDWHKIIMIMIVDALELGTPRCFQTYELKLLNKTKLNERFTGNTPEESIRRNINHHRFHDWNKFGCELVLIGSNPTYYELAIADETLLIE